MRTPRPDAVHDRRDAFQLWLHLIDRGVQFHEEADPAEWLDASGRQALTMKEIATFRRLVAEVDRLGAVTFDCYADAQRLRDLVTLGVNTDVELELPRVA